MRPSRRALLRAGIAGLACAAGCGRVARPSVCAPTEDNAAGPFYRGGAPARAALGVGLPGRRLRVSGVVGDTACRPIPSAAIELWQADSEGVYRDALRGRLVADAAGAWSVATVIPGRYRDRGRLRPAHIHARVTAPGFAALTTQLYFAGDPWAEGDDLYRDALALTVRPGEHGDRAEFAFTLRRLD